MMLDVMVGQEEELDGGMVLLSRTANVVWSRFLRRYLEVYDYMRDMGGFQEAQLYIMNTNAMYEVTY